MTLADRLRFALTALQGARLRTTLMLLAMAIGGASVVLLTSLGEGARRYVIGQFSSLGTHLVIVFPGRNETTGDTPPMLSDTPRDLTLEDALSLQRLPAVRHIAPVNIGSADIAYRNRDREAVIMGTTEAMQTIRGLELTQGRFLPPMEARRAAPVAVIGEVIRLELFGNQRALGEWVRIGERRFRVIGVMAASGVSLGVDTDELAVIPIASAQQLFNTRSLFRILVQASGRETINTVKAATGRLLRERHHGEEDVTVITQDALLTTFDRIFNALTLTVAGIAAISLVVAGILIMNIMLRRIYPVRHQHHRHQSRTGHHRWRLGRHLRHRAPAHHRGCDSATAAARGHAAEPVTAGNAMVEGNGRSRRGNVYGVGSHFPTVFTFELASGRFLPDDDPRSARAFVVLGHTMAEELFARRNPIGERIRVGGSRYRVIGVMQPKGQMLGFDIDDTVYIPTAKALEMFERDSLMEIDVLYRADANIEAVAAAIKTRLLARHGREDFAITTQEQMLEVLNSVLDVLTLAVAALGGISLLVGAVGILTIMTIAVRERTGEIGLLRALGSSRRQVLLLFLGEATILALLGGLAGLGLGLGGALLLGLAIPALPVRIAWDYVLLAECLAAAIGLLAGILPARHAAHLDPVEALRTE